MNHNKDYSGEYIGKYLLIKKLGRGHFGSVYKAKDSILKTETAIKIISCEQPEAIEKLFNESAIPYKCRHPNIVTINNASIENFKDDDFFIIDMELLSDGSLEDLLQKGKVSVTTVLKYASDILFALHHSHNHDFVHRDIKPGNILINNDMAKLSDFGLATILGEKLFQGIWYTPHKAPEANETKCGTAQTDIYALGLTMFRVVNQIPDWDKFLEYDPKRQQLFYNKTLVEKGEFAPHVPDKVKKIIKKACRKNLEKRYQSANEMRNAIDKLTITYNWEEIEPLRWRGTSKSDQRTIDIVKKTSSYQVVVKRNNRKIGDDCRSFSSQQDAEKYLYEYIATHTLKG